MPLRTIIVEDEPLSLLFLKSLLAEYCPQVEIIAASAAEDEAVNLINQLKPDLVLMDIELQQGNGFSVLQRTAGQRYHTIFTTALDYAGIRAIRFSGVSYLQKPIDLEALQAAVEPIATDAVAQQNHIATEHLLLTLNNNNKPLTLLLQTGEGPYYVSLDEIIYIHAENNACIFYTQQHAVAAIGHGIKDYEVLLQEQGFFRPHADYIIRLDKISPDFKTGSTITMINDAKIPLSPKKLEELQSLLFSPA